MDYKFLLEAILKYRDQGIVVVNTNANVVYYNEPQKSIFEIDKENAIGKNILDIFDGLSEQESTFYHVLKT